MSKTFGRAFGHTWFLGILLAVMAAAVFFVAQPAPKVEPDNKPPEPWPVYELPKYLASHGDKSLSVRVGLQRAPVPTADPLVWTYHPSDNAALWPKVYELHFTSPPAFPARSPYVVEGVVVFVPDGLRRGSGVGGYVRLTGAVLVK